MATKLMTKENFYRARAEGAKAEYLKRCSKAELAAMYLNDEITTDEYFEAIKAEG